MSILCIFIINVAAHLKQSNITEIKTSIKPVCFVTLSHILDYLMCKQM